MGKTNGWLGSQGDRFMKILIVMIQLYLLTLFPLGSVVADEKLNLYERNKATLQSEGYNRGYGNYNYNENNNENNSGYYYNDRNYYYDDYRGSRHHNVGRPPG